MGLVIGIFTTMLLGFIALTLWAKRRQDRLLSALAERPGWSAAPASELHRPPWYAQLPGMPHRIDARLLHRVEHRASTHRISMDLVGYHGGFDYVYAIQAPTRLPAAVVLSRYSGSTRAHTEIRIARDGLTMRVDPGRFGADFSNTFSVFAKAGEASTVDIPDAVQALMVQRYRYDYVLSPAGMVIAAGSFSPSLAAENEWLDGLERLPRLLAPPDA